MKRILFACAAMLVMVAASAQIGGELGTTFRASLLDYDQELTVLCGCDEIGRFVYPHYHHDPVAGMYSDSRHHGCVGDSALAQAIYLARLEKLREVRRSRLSVEAEKMVCNFEQLTGIRNSDDGDLFGPLYISSLALQSWEAWLKKNKDSLRFCSKHRVLYTVDTPGL